MKYLFLSVLYVSLFTACKAQTIYPVGTSRADISETPYYLKDINNHHDNLVGTWRWEDGDSYFELILEEFEMHSYPINDNMFIDAIYGKYTYVEEGEVIVQVDEIDTFMNFCVAMNFDNPTQYRMLLVDESSGRSKVGTFTLIPPENLTDPWTAKMELYNSEGIKIGYHNKPPFALPSFLTFTKVE